MTQKKIKAKPEATFTNGRMDIKNLTVEQQGYVHAHSQTMMGLSQRMGLAVFGKQVREVGKMQAVPTTWLHGAPLVQDLIDSLKSLFISKTKGQMGIKDLITVMSALAGEQFGITIAEAEKAGQEANIDPDFPEVVGKAFEAGFLTSMLTAIHQVEQGALHIAVITGKN